MTNATHLAFSVLSLLPMWALRPHSHVQHRHEDTNLSLYNSSGGLAVRTFSQEGEDRTLYERFFHRVRHGF